MPFLTSYRGAPGVAPAYIAPGTTHSYARLRTEPGRYRPKLNSAGASLIKEVTKGPVVGPSGGPSAWSTSKLPTTTQVVFPKMPKALTALLPPNATTAQPSIYNRNPVGTPEVNAYAHNLLSNIVGGNLDAPQSVAMMDVWAESEVIMRGVETQMDRYPKQNFKYGIADRTFDVAQYHTDGPEKAAITVVMKIVPDDAGNKSAVVFPTEVAGLPQRPEGGVINGGAVVSVIENFQTMHRSPKISNDNKAATVIVRLIVHVDFKTAARLRWPLPFVSIGAADAVEAAVMATRDLASLSPSVNTADARTAALQSVRSLVKRPGVTFKPDTLDGVVAAECLTNMSKGYDPEFTPRGALAFLSQINEAEYKEIKATKEIWSRAAEAVDSHSEINNLWFKFKNVITKRDTQGSCQQIATLHWLYKSAASGREPTSNEPIVDAIKFMCSQVGISGDYAYTARVSDAIDRVCSVKYKNDRPARTRILKAARRLHSVAPNNPVFMLHTPFTDRATISGAAETPTPRARVH